MAVGDGKSIRVLHVEDDPDFADLTSEFLAAQHDHFQVKTAANAEEGLSLLNQSEFDCIVSDHDMPGENGIEFLESVRENDPDIPFLLFTGKGSEEIASEAITAGVDDYLQKSPGTDQFTLLANRISNAVEKRRSSLEAAHTRRFYSKLIEHTTDVIPVIDSDGVVTYLSPSCEWILGYDPAEMVGENAFEFIHPDDLDEAAEKFQETVENPESMPELEYRFKHADGSWVRLHGRARNLLEDPDVGGIVSYNRVIEEDGE